MAQLRRDRLTWLVYLQLGVYGYFLYGFGPTVPLLREEQDISRTLSGLHGTALAVGALVAGTTTAAIVRRWGRATALWGGLAIVCLGAVAYVSTTALAADADRRLPRLARWVLHRHCCRTHPDGAPRRGRPGRDQ